jgi:hypothetical protein
MPLWPLILATVAAALWANRRSLGLPGHCPSATTTSAPHRAPAEGALICPECGATSAA